MFQKILRFSTFQTPNKKTADLDVSGDFNIFNFLDPPKMRKMQIWMLQKILTFQTSHEKNADLDVSEDFKIFNFLDPQK